MLPPAERRRSGDAIKLSMAVGLAAVRDAGADAAMLAKFPKTEIVSSFGVGYDHIDFKYAAGHNIIVTNTPDVLTEEVADTAATESTEARPAG